MIVAFIFLPSAKAQNVYSGGTGNYNGITWYLNAGRTIPCACTPGALNTINIGNGHNVTIPSNTTVTFAGIVVHDAGASGTLTIGNNTNTASNITVTGDITINNAGTLQVGGNGGATHSVTFRGNITNGNVFNLVGTLGDVVNATFGGTATRTVSGTGGTFQFNGLTMNSTSNSNLTVNSDIRITGALTFSANGLIVPDASSSITLGGAATVSGSNANRYIQLDDTSGSSQLIKVSNGTTASWRIVYPIGTATGGYTPLDLSAATIATNPTNNSTLSVKSIYSASVIGQMRRTFRLTVSGNAAATTFTNGNFYYNSGMDVSAGDALPNYSTIWYLNSNSGSWSTVTGTAPGSGYFTAPGAAQSLTTGTYYYTLGISTAYPSTWYSYQNGVWSNPNVWTLDPSGTSLINSLSRYPSLGDQVVILNGFTVTCDLNDLTIGTTTIDAGAVLDMAATTGHNLGTVSGAGLLRINGVSLPSGTYTSFVAASTGGTVEYYDAGGALSATQTTYNNLVFSNSTNADITFVTASNLTVNSDLKVEQTSGSGTVTWQINDGSANQRTMSIAGDLTISANGQIAVGTGNENSGAPHNLTIYGDLTNDGLIKFFDATDTELSEAQYTSGGALTNELQGNAVAVTFSGSTDNTVNCNNTTDFYRLILDKGTGTQAKLTINSTSTANLRLFGPNDLGSSGTDPNRYSNNALSIVNGTLELTGSIDIPNLSEGGGSISLPQSGVLWLNGADVSVTVTSNSTGIGGNSRMLFVYGLLRVSNGTFSTGYSRGLLCAQSGQLLVEGGTVNTWQLRTTNSGTGNNFAYVQSGGTVNVGMSALTGESINTFPRFALPYAETVFRMTGGILNVGNPMAGGTSNTGGIMINSDIENIEVTGGTVNVYIPASNTDFTITSNAPFYNLNIYKEGAGAGVAILNSITFNDGSGNTTQNGQPLTVLNNLSIINGNDPTFNSNSLDLSVGGNFDIQTGTTFSPGANTITFNGSGAQAWTHNGTISSLNNIVVAKSAGTLTLGGTNAFPNIAGLTLTSGTLNDGGKQLIVTGTLSNSAVHTGSGSIQCNGPATIGGSNGTFGNLDIYTNATVATSGGQTVTGTLRLIGANTSLNIASHNLAVLGNIYSDAATGTSFSTSKRIITNGLRNDGGLTRQATSGSDLLFPVGTTAASTAYTPVTINATASTAGTITVRPVTGAHPNVTSTGQSAQYYWRVSGSGFSGITNVIHKSYTHANATRDAASTSYRPARYDPALFTWSYGPVYNATAGAGTTTIPDFNTATGWTGIGTTQLDGEYTAGNAAAFGIVSVYYSRSSGSWGSTTTWSTVAVGGAAASSIPCGTCPVVIGDGASNNHTITIDANSRTCGSLSIASGSILDCGTYTSLNFGVNTGIGVSGKGTLRVASANFPGGDFTNFIGTDGGTVEWYGASKTIPTTGPAPANMNLSNYYSLTVTPAAGQTITMPGTDLIVYSNFTVSGANNTAIVASDVSGSRTITVGNQLNVSSGVFRLQNGNTTNVVVNGNTSVSNGASFSVQDASGNRIHTFTTSGTVTNNGIILFRSAAGSEFVNVTFTGTANAYFTGTNGSASTTLNLLTVNKGASQTPVLTFDVAGTVNTLNDGWLDLQNGTIDFNKTGGNFTLTNTATAFSIPSTARLKVQAGTVNIGNINNNAADLSLAGALEVAGGTVNVGVSTNNNNNDIEYAAAGTPSIVISSGSLYVNGAVRRPTTTISGALVYSQSGGTAIIGGRNVSNTRGVFEIENNSGSSFTLSGAASLTVARSSGGSSYADLYLNPQSSSVAATSTIEVGANTNGAQTLSVNVVPSVGNFTVMGATGNAQTVNLQSSGLTVAGTLAVNQASQLNTNSLDVNIGGDLSINASGTYNGANNTTTFNGAGAQSGVLSASSTFLNITVNKTSGTATLSGTSPTITNLNILSGVLDVSTIGLTVVGDIVNNSSQTGTGSITLSGSATSHTITSSGGSFTNLTLGTGSTTKTVTVNGNMTINGVLNFATTNRYLSIGSSQLTFGTGSSVTGAGSSAFVRTNGVSSDLGVVKNWAVGASTFTYPVGTMNNYTPVQASLTVTTAGALTVIPVNSRHSSYGFSSTEQILNYYWIVTRSSALAYSTTGSHVYSYPAGLMGGSGGTLRAGYLDLSNPTGWVTTGHGGTANTTTMTYTNLLDGNLPAANITYHLTAGTVNTLPNPIAPVYSRLSNANVSNIAVGGNWSDPSCWTLSSTGFGASLSTAPLGAPIVILSGARINMDADSRSALTTLISGVLDLGTSVGHDLGVISGTGTLRSSTNTFPAGNYTAFVSAAGGTIEYVAPMTMNNRATYNNISITGTGSVTMTNTDIVLNGNLVIASGATLNNSTNNSDITIAGNWTNNGGFTAGTGLVTFNGSAAQAVSGSSTFNSLTVNKPAGNLTLSGSATTTVNGVLTMTSGHIVSSLSHILSLSLSATATGGSANSFISGPVRKLMAAGSSFSYFTGSVSANRYRPVVLSATSALDTWTVRYAGNDPGMDGYSSYSLNNANIQKVSEFEYWDITRTGAASATVSLSYNTGSYHGGNIGTVANLRVAHWDGALWDFPSGGGAHSQSGTDITGTVTVTNVTSFSPFTLSSLDPPSPLPVTWLSFAAERVDNITVKLFWKTAQELNNDRFEIERSEDGMSFYRIGFIAGAGTSLSVKSYRHFDTEASASRRHYYRIKQIDYDGQSDYSTVVVVQATGPEQSIRWTVYPNPVAEGQSLAIESVDSMDDDEFVDIVVVAPNGQQVLHTSGKLNEQRGTLERLSSTIDTGVYVLKISNGEHFETFRIVRY